MNRRLFLQTGMVAAAGAALSVPFAQAAPGKIGNRVPAEFRKINKEVGARIAAIQPTDDALSEADAELLAEVALRGMIQLEMSRAAISKTAHDAVRAIAHAEIEEQNGLSAKLKEIATAKGAKVPVSPDEKTRKRAAQLEDKSGTELDREYLKESGVDGHQMLQKTMEKVQAKATDATLKRLASVALPLIQMHLEVATQEMKDIT